MNSAIGEIYANLWSESRAKYEKGEFETDRRLNDIAGDRRMGITLAAKLGDRSLPSVQTFVSRCAEIEPDLYVYPESDWHITVLSIISCDAAFKLEDIDIEAYEAVIQKAAQNTKPFEVAFQGITASPSCVMLQGFPSNGSLDQLRGQLRKDLASSGLHATVDARYFLRTAHATVIRYRSEPHNPERFVELLDSYREVDFGTVRFASLSLVTNNWYMNHTLSPELARIDLGK